MSDEIQANPIERALVRVYGLIARRLDLQSGFAGRVYRRVYFAYKRFTDRALLRVVRRSLAPGAVVLDVGANIGSFTLAVAHLGDVQVVAFEPDAKNFAQLEAELAKSGVAGRVQAHRLALSDTTGTAQLYLSDAAPTDHKLINTRSSASVDVATTTLDDFMHAHPLEGARRLALIKIDVQGAELMVLRGMRQTLAQQGYPPILVEYAPADLKAASVTPSDFFAAFAELGYRPHTVADETQRDPQWIIANTRTYTNLLMRVP